MRTKALKLIVLLMALLPSFLQSNAANVIIDSSGNSRPIVVKSTGTHPPRSIEPECYYQDGYVYIIGDASVTSISATVTRLSDNAQWSNSGTSNTLQVAVPTDAGAYRLELTLSDGSSYYGDYTL